MTYIWPVSDGVTQEYGANADPVVQPGGHTGMDFGCAVGTPIYAEADGVIVFADWSDALGWPNPYYIATSAIRPGGAGICVALDVGGFQFWHAHCSRTDLNAGDHVKQGDIIGYTGDTGYCFGAHLHLDVLPDGWNVNSSDGRYGRVNPRDVIDGSAVTAQGGITGGPGIRKVTNDVAMVRLNPWSWADTAPGLAEGISKDSELAVVGYVQGQAVTPGNNAWYQTKSGFYVWANAAEDNINGLVYLGAIAVPPQPIPEPAPVPAPAPAPTPVPAPVTPAPPAPPARLNGVDISKAQHGLDLVHLPGDFVVIKASEGVGFTDPDLGTFANAVPAGTRRMFYHFTRNGATAGNTAAAEAAYFLSAVRPYLRPGDALALDWEDHEGATDGSYGPNIITDTASAQKFLRIVSAATQSTPVLYLNVAAVNGADWSAVEAEFPLWLANYKGPVTGYNPPVDLPPVTWSAGFKMLQYTSLGRLPGWDKDLDLNVFLGGTTDWDALTVKVLPALPGPVTSDTPPPAVVVPGAAFTAAQAQVLSDFALYLLNQKKG